MLKFKAVSYKEVHVRDLDEYCEEVYGRNFKLDNGEGWGEHGAYFVCTVTGGMSKEAAARWIGHMSSGYTKHAFNCSSVLEALVADGYAEPGNYLIKPGW